MKIGLTLAVANEIVDERQAGKVHSPSSNFCSRGLTSSPADLYLDDDRYVIAMAYCGSNHRDRRWLLGKMKARPID